MRSTCLLALSFLCLLIGAAPTGAQESTFDAIADSADCVDASYLSNALIECGGAEYVGALEALTTDSSASEFDASGPVGSGIEALHAAVSALDTSEAFIVPSYCRLKVDAVFWGGRQPFELAQAIDEDHSQCAEYHITVPPLEIRTRLDCAPFAAIRDLDSPIHPLAEIRWTSPTGWRAWVVSPTHRDRPRPAVRTFYGAGVIARQRMAACGLDVTAGETWAFNELTEEVLENTPVVDGPHAGKSARVEVLEFMRGLYDGAPGMPKALGLVFNLTTRSDEEDLAEYKEHLQSWLEDAPFWTELDIYSNFFAQEVYASSRSWGVADAPLATRARYLNDYFHHPMVLAENGPATVEAARIFFRRTYVPLANAAWPHPLIGETHLLSAQAMSQFISTQVYALRHYSNSHPQAGPGGRIGFGWAPIEEFEEHGYTHAGRDLIRTRLANAIHEASEEGTNSQMGACGLPGEHVWCTGDVEGGALNGAWKTFMSWD